MYTITNQEIENLKTSHNSMPCVSLIFPFTVKYGAEQELHKLLKLKSNQLHHALSNEFPDEIVHSILSRYLDLCTKVKDHNYVKGYAFYLSPQLSKMFELNFKPTEKLIIDDSFELRDLFIHNSSNYQFLVLLCSGNEEKFLKYEAGKLSKLSVHVPKRIEAFMQNTLHDVDIYYEKSDRKEKARDFFIKNADEGIDLLSKTYPWPILIIGPEKFVSHLRLQSKFAARILEAIEGNVFESSESEIIKLIQNVIPNIEKRNEEQLLAKLDEANNANRLVFGIKDVWRETTNKNGRILVVEKNFTKQALHGDDFGEVSTYEADKAHFPIQDAVDDILELVIAQGGEIKFVNDGILGKYRRIALIKYHLS